MPFTATAAYGSDAHLDREAAENAQVRRRAHLTAALPVPSWQAPLAAYYQREYTLAMASRSYVPVKPLLPGSPAQRRTADRYLEGRDRHIWSPVDI